MVKILACLAATGFIFNGLAFFGTAAPAYDAVYVFGDSLTDTGREGPEPPLDVLYFNHRYSNGPLWVEHLTERLGLIYNASNNYATSGAQTDDTLGQVTNFQASASVAASLFAVWAGGNDFLQEYDKYWFNDAGWDALVASSVGNLSNAVVFLIDHGARSILVPTTVDVTRIPTIHLLPLPSLALDYLREKVNLFNARLSDAIDRIRVAHPEVRLWKADMYNRLEAILGTSTLYGFTETEIGAIDDPVLLDKSFGGPGRNYLFWDPIHPTTKMHALVADFFLLHVAPLSPRLSLSSSANRTDLLVTNLHLGKRYLLQQSTNLIDWSALRQVTVFGAPSWRGPVTNDAPRRFYRLH